MTKIDFNNGFVTAIALFLEHKSNRELIIKNKNNEVLTDLRLYASTDHIYDLEIPKMISIKLKSRINKWRIKCFNNRLEHHRNTELTDKLFKEAEDILAKIDMEVFHTKKVVMNYR